MVESESGITAYAEMTSGGRTAKKERFEPFKIGITKIRSAKIASGIAVLAAGEELFNCVPPWGIMTGVRPAKIALPMVDAKMTPAQVRQTLIRDYFLNPKKAALLTNIAKKEAKIINSTPKNTCSVYISIPFCPSRCAYCSFVSYSTKRLLSMVDEYLLKLYDDIDRVFENINRLGLKVLTVYVGGGTPTVLDNDQMKSLLTKITSHVDPDTLLEFTYEAGRPDTVTAEKMAIVKAFGVTRISVNPQTLSDDILREIG
jgi:oxygen-independent coproporphyrinogen-3 oxidase